ncbi:MAG: DUF1330 domain-containing protein [Halieaceae bacterium]|nr:DUF1330 domain-containing protein [Halieaceae bacterium]MBT6181029.1 DUF1330 domain-containing protein [Halieaceae bacterium]MDA8754631.1 DUF1330 domain-containing protein [Luminiphilus sp.]
MNVENSVIPTQAQMAEFLMPGPDGSIFMVNLLKFKDEATYEDNRQTTLTGKEAYAIYSAGVINTLAQVGGKVVFSGDVSRLMLGEVEELWDSVAIAQYPSRASMLEMMQLKEYREIAVHRSAGLAGQLNIETTDTRDMF